MVERKVRSVLLIAHKKKKGAAELASEIASRLKKHNVTCERFIYSTYADNLQSHRPFDLVITLGGDGTVLYAVRLMVTDITTENIPILPLNLATFGFITEILCSEWEDTLHAYQSGAISAYPRMLLSVQIASSNGTKYSQVGIMNDVVISVAELSKLLHLSVFVGNDLLGRYRADGVIIATPTGSTAYSVSANGPVLHPEMDAIILNPICPFTLSHRPLVLPPDEVINIVVEENQRTELVLNVDGQLFSQLSEGDVITVRRSAKRALIIRSDRRTFYDVLRTKLGWSGGSND